MNPAEYLILEVQPAVFAATRIIDVPSSPVSPAPSDLTIPEIVTKLFPAVGQAEQNELGKHWIELGARWVVVSHRFQIKDCLACRLESKCKFDDQISDRVTAWMTLLSVIIHRALSGGQPLTNEAELFQAFSSGRRRPGDELDGMSFTNPSPVVRGIAYAYAATNPEFAKVWHSKIAESALAETDQLLKKMAERAVAVGSEGA